MPPALVLDLACIARQEQAELHVIYDTDQQRPLVGLVRAAEYTQRTNPRLAAERARWARPPGDPWPDGVPAPRLPSTAGRA